MRYAVVTSMLLASVAFEGVEIASAQQAPLPPVVIAPSTPTSHQQGQKAARQNNAGKKKKRTAVRAAPPSPASGAPAQTATGPHNPATNPNYNPGVVSLGPLGNRSLLDTPFSVTPINQDFMENLQLKTVNDTLRYLPSVEIRNQQGYEVSRPQSRGFQGTVVQNTRMDGLNVIGTTAIAAESLNSVQVLNGMAGALYGPMTPAGVFNYVLSRPTETQFFRYTESYNSGSVFTEQIDAGGMVGLGSERLGYRIT